MDTHSMSFVTIGNLVSPSSSVNGDPLDDFSDHWQPGFFFEFPSSPDKWRGEPARPLRTKRLVCLGCYGNGDLVEGRVGNLIGFNLGSSLNHSR